MTQTHLATGVEDDLGCDASALGGGGPDRLDGGTGGLSRASSSNDGSVSNVNSVAEANATSLIAEINEQLGPTSDDLWISLTTQLKDELVFKGGKDVMASDHGPEGLACL
ncbi:hypothetical protein GUJ93_ZPchr0013g34449 [Zizania palustris]|uniref:Uncharacterized protein n=1 Tax=Zizania palustris TaxID=103762 RepID=A0A8J6C0H4_ZIZPA|nr:hypothetical protein GUJ93_ZPchr0013g34449 [Zizania palustris]